MPDEQAQNNPAAPAIPAAPEVPARPKCGLVMPISAIGDCTASHWADVKAILTEAIVAAGFDANLVSFANESRIIQNTIVENLYQNEMVVVDVSWKNPNVMFELGLRLAFDRPTIVVKDHETDYAFDTSPIVHLLYPRSLRYAQIVEFKKELATKVKATYEAAKDPNYKSFVKTFGITKVATIETKELPQGEYIIEQLRKFRAELQEIRRMPTRAESVNPYTLAASTSGLDALSDETRREWLTTAARIIRCSPPTESMDRICREVQEAFVQIYPDMTNRITVDEMIRLVRDTVAYCFQHPNCMATTTTSTTPPPNYFGKG
jgi:hypothetical protein